MEAFFFLSGMFFAMVILRKVIGFFYRNRRCCVLVPLVSAFLFIPGLMYLIHAQIDGEPLSTQGVLHAYGLLHHLWFLLTLAAIPFLLPVSFFERAAALAFPAADRHSQRLLRREVLLKGYSEWASLSLVPVKARFLVFYAAGYAFYLNSEQIPRQARSLLVNSKVVLAFAVVCWLAFYATFHFNVTSNLRYLPVLCASVFSVMFSYWLVFTFEKLRMKENRLVQGIVDSALIIYIMHYPLVITFAWLLDSYLPNAMPVTYVAVVTALGLICSAALYLIFKQLPLLSRLFGLKPAKLPRLPAVVPKS
ncbi:glucan biosynthesis protein|nr:glucan biosynthesis protein [Candidatus Pantoea persica]